MASDQEEYCGGCAKIAGCRRLIAEGRFTGCRPPRGKTVYRTEPARYNKKRST